MTISRRNFIAQAGALGAAGLVGNLSQWGIRAVSAQSLSDYKALVCVFLFGGNDSNNTVIPYDNYGSYSAVRTSASNINIPQDQLLQISPPSAGAKFGLHPNLGPLQTLFNDGKLAVIVNAGPLLAPLTKAQYQAGINRPLNLFSHSDQQNEWQGLIDGTAIRTGWGGRVGDKINVVNQGAVVPTIVSVAGGTLITQGINVGPFVLPASGGVLLAGTGTDPISQARINGVHQMLSSVSSNNIVNDAAAELSSAVTTGDAISPVLATTSPIITAAFNGLNTGIALQLKQIARVIEARSMFGAKRQFFFASLGGFDTHGDELNVQGGLLGQLAPALKAFYDATVQLGVADKIKSFTHSDFSRTFIANSTRGTDHAWGAHHFVIGGAVRGGDFYGTFPDLSVRGANDSGTNGAWLPTISVDQIGATLATWFGVSSTDLDYVFPNLSRFSTANLGFLNS
jgi:uncharacterized protein (DUF1501 family)